MPELTPNRPNHTLGRMIMTVIYPHKSKPCGHARHEDGTPPSTATAIRRAPTRPMEDSADFKQRAAA